METIETTRLVLRPSRGLLEKAGFRREALFRQYISFRQDAAGEPIWSDTCVYAMLESDQERN